MALVEHLKELRNRFLVAVGAIVLAAIPGWFAYEPILVSLTQPLRDRHGDVNFAGLTDPFAVQLMVSLFVALIIASPVWVYEIWAFIVPGLKSKEKRTALAFLLAAVPLFVAGCWMAYLTLPKAVDILLGFTPEGAVNIMPAADYLRFATRFILAFGSAFLLPVFLVGLNVARVLPASTMLSGWRFAVVAIFIFAAVMTPTPDPWTMCFMALPMIGLYFLACGVAHLHDRRRARDRPDWSQVPDDQASPL